MDLPVDRPAASCCSCCSRSGSAASTRRGKSPLVPPHLFSHASFTGGVILALVYFAAFTSIFFTISIFWQAGLGHTALESGLVSVPFAIGSIVGASQSNRLAQRLGRTTLVDRHRHGRGRPDRAVAGAAAGPRRPT